MHTWADNSEKYILMDHFVMSDNYTIMAASADRDISQRLILNRTPV